MENSPSVEVIYWSFNLHFYFEHTLKCKVLYNASQCMYVDLEIYSKFLFYDFMRNLCQDTEVWPPTSIKFKLIYARSFDNIHKTMYKHFSD